MITFWLEQSYCFRFGKPNLVRLFHYHHCVFHCVLYDTKFIKTPVSDTHSIQLTKVCNLVVYFGVIVNTKKKIVIEFGVSPYIFYTVFGWYGGLAKKLCASSFFRFFKLFKLYSLVDWAYTVQNYSQNCVWEFFKNLWHELEATEFRNEAQ